MNSPLMEFSQSVDALIGLAAFPAEQVLAMSLSKNGLDLDWLWERKCQAVEQTPGLTIWRGGEDRKSTRLNSSHGYISYAVFCLKKKKQQRRAHLRQHNLFSRLQLRATLRQHYNT